MVLMPQAGWLCRTRTALEQSRFSRRNLVAAGLAAALLGAIAPLVSAAKDDAGQDFRAAKASIQRLLRSRKVEDRVDAMRQLQEFAVLDAVKMALQAGAREDAPAVRSAAFEALSRLSDNEEICQYLLGTLTRQARRNELNVHSVPVLAALLTAKSPDVERSVDEFLDKTVDKSKGGVLVLTELADELGTRDEDDSLRPLVRLTKTKPFANHFGVRRAVVWALIRLDRVESLGALVTLLGDIQGEARADMIKYLTAVTGQNFPDDPPAWAAWWQKNKDTFVMPVPAARTPVSSVATAGTPYYYGLPIYAQKIVFVLDTSGSMNAFNGFRLTAAKRELVNTIFKLRDGDQFSIIVFNSSVSVWQKKLVSATVANRKAAAAFVEHQQANGNTASYDALETAFNFEAEAIFFLTDGAPHGGKISSPDQIVQAISLMNRPRRESIYTIGVAVGIANGPFELFLKALAEENFGSYRRVDQ